MTEPTLTIRQRVINALAARLRDHTWVSAPAPFNVHVGRAAFALERHPLPILTILPQPEESETSRYGTDKKTMPVELVALVAYDPATADDDPEADLLAMTEPILGEITAAAMASEPDPDPGDPPNPEALDNLANSVTYTGGGLADYPADQGQTVVQITVGLSISYETLRGDPYSQ